jgi:hypothetical protein
MLAFSAAILAQFDAVGIVTLVFHRHVVFAFATAANQGDLFTHNSTSLKKADRVGLLKNCLGAEDSAPGITEIIR